MDAMGVTHAERDRPKRASFVKMRLLIAIMATLCPVVCYMGRQNLPLAIVSMVQDNDRPQPALDAVLNPTPLPDAILGKDLGLVDSLTPSTSFIMNVARNNSETGPSSSAASAQTVPESKHSSSSSSSSSSAVAQSASCPEPGDATAGHDMPREPKVPTYGPKYDWSQEDRALLLGAFFYTYVIFQIPGARLAERIGAKWILAAASSGTALLSLASPWAAAQHVYLLWAARLLMGVFQAAIYPSCYVLYSKWLPPMERSQGLPVLGVGAFIGSIAASSLAGYFSEQPAFGWEWAFYVPGILCALWSLVWIWFASNEPREHKFISIEELQHIQTGMLELSDRSLAKKTTSPGDPEAALGSISASAKKDISWRKLFGSRAIWIMMAAFFASNWSFTIVLLLVPTYLNDILQVSPMDNGKINSIIYVLFCVCSPLVGKISTMMVETRACGLSRLNIRKLFQCTALFGLASCFIGITVLGCDRRFVLGLLFTQIVFFSLVNGGEVQLPAELSPDFSGTIYAIGNCVGSSTGFIVPKVFSLIVTESRDRAAWNTYFYLAAIITALGALIFLLFGQNKMQDYSKDLSESQLDFGQLGLTGAKKGHAFGMLDSQHLRSQRSSRVLPPPPPPSSKYGEDREHSR